LDLVSLFDLWDLSVELDILEPNLNYRDYASLSSTRCPASASRKAPLTTIPRPNLKPF